MEEKIIGGGYVAPEIKKIEIKSMRMFCEISNQSLYEIDYGNGGFTEI